MTVIAVAPNPSANALYVVPSQVLMFVPPSATKSFPWNVANIGTVVLSFSAPIFVHAVKPVPDR